ncbi:ATP-binding protein [Phosphitispora fastidiosa]|uniref:ATP-binding protein n=1 Tax=Phosphitispora fastidiosa TaxID=2837202 RepID=UPI001E2DF8DF|nr:Pyruvate/2-oxoacid:ferredoxin oxidoreductase delta subunit [Phosphitispora fastidiosa]
MLRKIVEINEEKCTGCGLCIAACHEGALQLVNGKARLVSDSYCDGLGDCLPNCPADAINIIEREAAAFDEEAVKKHMESRNSQSETLACGCPGSSVTVLQKSAGCSCAPGAAAPSQLGQWPCQIKLVPVNAPFLDNSDLLIAADCSAYAYGNFHQDFIRGRVTLIGCPKLDNVDYAEKLTEMFRLHEIKGITVVRMTVPCCGSLVNRIMQAVINSGQDIPVKVVTIDTDGTIIPD